MSKDLNHITIIGNLTRDPEFQATSTGATLCKISIANNDDYKETKYCNFFDCIAWGKLAETINMYLKKGNRVAINGKIKQERWEHEGKAKSRVTITISEIQFLMTKNNADPSTANVPDNYSGVPGSNNPYNDDVMPF